MGGETCNVIPNGKACLSNYCSDNAISLIALSAEVRLVGPQGERRTQLEKIFSGNGARPFAIDPGEVLVQIRVPLKKNRSAYEKLRVRGSIDYPLVGAAVSCGDADAAVCVGGVGPMPFVYHLKSSDVRELETSARHAYSAARTISNTVLSPGYRKKMVRVLVKRAALKALQEGR
jgi:4-hydroxybenzoyl-CoA reductase subunit beta